jgi:hypothetical protein
MLFGKPPLYKGENIYRDDLLDQVYAKARSEGLLKV